MTTAKILQSPEPPRRGASDAAPWPEHGFVSIKQLMVALTLTSRQTIYNHVRRGWLPPPVAVGARRIAWRAEDARRAIEQLPDRVQRSRGASAPTARPLAGPARSKSSTTR